MRVDKVLCLVGLLFFNWVDVANAADEIAQQLKQVVTESCQHWQATGELSDVLSKDGVETSEIKFRQRNVGTRYRIALTDTAFFEIDVIDATGKPRFIGKHYSNSSQPSLHLALGLDCGIRNARKIVYDGQKAVKITQLDKNLKAGDQHILLNPALEWQPRESLPTGYTLRVAMVDSGVNYQLPEINQHLARESNGKLIGYDFWDMDELPYDAHPSRSPFFVQRHGTRTASLLLREAPGIELVPYRYPRADMSRMRLLVEHAAQNQVEILGMPLGSNNKEEWLDFEQVARAHPGLLFIVSAGNNGRDIDQQPVYPAALKLDNMIVVTSADDFVRPAERSNWGIKSVDYLLPAEAIALTDYSGKTIKASGSSYAVARMTALVARIKQANGGRSVTQIKNEVRRIAGLNRADTSRWVSAGYIADPLIGHVIEARILPDMTVEQRLDNSRFQLNLDVIRLDPNWSRAKIKETLQRAYDVLSQCGIGVGTLKLQMVTGADYLQDLSSGSAHTLFNALDTSGLNIVFARDTRMTDAFDGEAFGEGNTRNRPWLRDSVWLMLSVENAGIALAHEMFHVIANSGEHVDDIANLMQSRTQSDNIGLNEAQCQLAQTTGLKRGLLFASTD